MASVSQGNATLQVTGGVTNLNAQVNSSITMSGVEVIDATQVIGTSSEQITLGEIGTPQKLLIKNLDTTNYVEIDSADTYDKFPQKLVAGDWCILCPQTGTIHAKANTAAVRIRKVAMSL